MKIKFSLSLFYLIISFMFIFSLSSCSNKTEQLNLQKSEVDSLMRQVAEHEIDKRYADFLRDEAFASVEIYGIDKRSEKCVAYVHLYTSEYVDFKGKAYEMSGSSGEAIIKFNYINQSPNLTDIQWSADGGDHEDWMKKNFPKKYFLKSKEFNRNSDNTKKLQSEVIKKAEDEMKVPVESNNLLIIDFQKMTYEILKTSDYNGKFETETIEKGSLMN